MHVKSAKSDGAGKNMSSLCDVEVILGLSYILPLFECVHALIKIAQNKNIFVCNFVDSMNFIGSIVTHMLSLKTQHLTNSMPLKP